MPHMIGVHTPWSILLKLFSVKKGWRADTMESMLLIWKFTVVKSGNKARVAMNCISGSSHAYFARSMACCSIFRWPAFLILVGDLQMLGRPSSIPTFAILRSCATPWSPIRSNNGFSSAYILRISASSFDILLSATNLTSYCLPPIFLQWHSIGTWVRLDSKYESLLPQSQPGGQCKPLVGPGRILHGVSHILSQGFIGPSTNMGTYAGGM